MIDRETFGRLHIPGTPLVLPNAWDVGSAVAVRDAGARAVATTSGGMAWSLGYRDGNRIPVETLLATVRVIAAAIDVPLTVDIESGYDRDADAAAWLAGAVHEAGAVGVNVEDSWAGRLLAPEEQAERIAHITSAAPDLFVNARIDTYLLGQSDTDDALGDTVARADAACKAGAAGIFVPGLVDLETVAALAARIDAPLNVMTGPGAPTVAEFAAVGVARISTGTALAQAAYGLARAAAERLLTGGVVEISGAIDYGRMNALLPE